MDLQHVLWILLALIARASANGPCASAQLIDQRLRSTGYAVADKTYDNLICDRTLPFGWYKFPPGIQLPTKCVARYHCGTHLPIWMNGVLPTATNSIVTVPVCAPAVSGPNCCEYRSTIRVANCGGGNYVYELKPTPGCSYAYCAGDRVPCPPDYKSQTGFQPGCVLAYPKMLNSPHLSNPIVAHNSFHFDCDINYDAARRDTGFEVQWYFDGKRDPNVPGTSITDGSTRKASLDQLNLAGHLGEEVSCAVRTFFLKTPTDKSPYIPSNGYWCGIKMSTNRLVVGENDKEQTVQMISTIPVVCPHNAQRSCKLEIYIDPFGNKGDLSQTRSCTQVFRPGDWDPATNQATTSFQIIAQRDFKKDGDKNTFLHFNPIFTGDAPPIFNNYQIPYLQVITKDKPTSSCSCTGDPHCYTFDAVKSHSGQRLNYYMVGDFTMFKSTNPAHNMEVQVRTWACGRVACNCAVSAKEGNDVIILDMCHTHFGTSFPRLYIPHHGSVSQGTVVKQDKAGNEWVISFPSGAEVHIKNIRGVALDVTIVPPEDDFGATQGLCGVFNGDSTDDLQYPDGVTVEPGHTGSYKADNFVNAWRIPPGDAFIDQKENIPIDQKYNHDKYYCKCDQALKRVDCRIDANKDPVAVLARCPKCTVNAVTNGHLNLAAISGRRRRATTDSRIDDHVPASYQYSYGQNFQPTLIADFPNAQGTTRAQAEKACRDGFANNPTIQQCTSNVGLDFSSQLDMCVEDYKYFDDGSFIASAVGTAIMECAEAVLTNVSYYDANGKPPAFITTDVCALACTDHGRCSHGTCVCDRGYVGDGCEIHATAPPTLSKIESTSYREDSIICDAKTRKCETIFVVGNNIYNNSKLSCKVEVLKFDGHTFVPSGRTFTTAAVYRTMYDTGCKLPANAATTGGKVTGYNISVTNDGHVYSDAVSAIRMDSTCMYCRFDGSNCLIKNHFCLIDGNCMAEGEHRTSDHNDVCDPTADKMQWTSTIQHTVTTPPTATLGGVEYARPDIWTFSQSGCQCAHNKSSYTCACCDDGGCQCPAPNQNQCTMCGSTSNCGSPQQAPDNGVDGYTLALADCQCLTDHTQFNCACCTNGGCQCGVEHRNQCVDCKHMDRCGSKPWIFGPPIPLKSGN